LKTNILPPFLQSCPSTVYGLLVPKNISAVRTGLEMRNSNVRTG